MQTQEQTTTVEETAGYAVTLDFPAAQREFSFHGCKVDISSISKAGLLYLLRLGFTTSLTQCNAGVASAGKEEGLKPEVINASLVKNREERLQKICDGTIGVRASGTGGSRKNLDEKLLADLAWSALQSIYARNNAKLPTKAEEKAFAIQRYLDKPGVKERLQAQVAALTSLGDEL